VDVSLGGDVGLEKLVPAIVLERTGPHRSGRDQGDEDRPKEALHPASGGAIHGHPAFEGSSMLKPASFSFSWICRRSRAPGSGSFFSVTLTPAVKSSLFFSVHSLYDSGSCLSGK